MEQKPSTPGGSLPKITFGFFRQSYHWILALAAAIIYRFPSRHIKLIGVTGTKGKSSVVEMLNAMLEEAGHKTAISSTIRQKVADESEANLYKMTMPGRFVIQRLLRRAVNAGCDYAVIEITSQGVLQYRHRWLYLDALVVTNIAPEHIEAHGSYENYIRAKLSIAERISPDKENTAIIVNADDREAQRFLSCAADRKITYGLKDAEPYKVLPEGLEFTLNGHAVHSGLSGIFNLYNILAAAAAARSEGVPESAIAAAAGKLRGIPGRVQKIFASDQTARAKQNFEVIVDYAHTPDSLEKFYQVFRPDPDLPRDRKLIAVLGGTGGGRDTWKRKEMGRIAARYCEEIILTDEDPYDEDPKKIVADVMSGIPQAKATVIMDRRLAIYEALARATKDTVVLITGKGTDPYIMGPKGSKTPWSDARIAREGLDHTLKDKKE